MTDKNFSIGENIFFLREYELNVLLDSIYEAKVISTSGEEYTVDRGYGNWDINVNEIYKSKNDAIDGAIKYLQGKKDE